MEPLPTPVMDVTPPVSTPDLLATPPPEEPDSQAEPAAIDTSEKLDTKKTAPKAVPAKQLSNTTAIIATVIIVLGLAALATYAYIKTK